MSHSLPLRLTVEVLTVVELINGSFFVITFITGNCWVKLLDKILIKFGLGLCSSILLLKIYAGVIAFIFNR